jgi:hypothetical protein
MWTDVADADPFLLIAAGRAHFRPAELLQLARLLAELKGQRRKSDFAALVRSITPSAERRRSMKRVQLHDSGTSAQLDLDHLTDGS